MSVPDLKIETRIGKKRKPRRILSIVSNTAQLRGFPVGFFAEEMTRAFLMFTEAGHQVDLASSMGGEVMFDAHSDPRTPGGAYVEDLHQPWLRPSREIWSDAEKHHSYQCD